MPRSEEELYAAAARGLRAAVDLEIAKPLLTERREYLIAQAISDLESGKMTELKSFTFVVALAENRKLLDDLERVERAGRRAGDQLKQ